MDRLLIFGDNNLIFPQLLIQEIYSFIKEREDITICGVVDTTKCNPLPKRIKILKVLAPPLVKKVFNFEQKLNFRSYMFNNLSDICSKLNIKVMVPPQRDINGQEFVNFLRESVRPTIGLSVGCLQVFKKDLINLFDILVNYHNGLLPAYGGLHATSWSIYFAEKHTGFTYHLVNQTIDGGNILLQGKVPMDGCYWTSDLEYLKTVKAAECIGNVLSKMIARDRGIAQDGERTYFGRKEFEAITTINDPDELTYEETERRLFAFKWLNVKIDGIYYPITKIRKHNPTSTHNKKLVFITQDQIPVEPLRFLYLPFSFYKIYSFIKKVFNP